MFASIPAFTFPLPTPFYVNHVHILIYLQTMFLLSYMFIYFLRQRKAKHTLVNSNFVPHSQTGWLITPNILLSCLVVKTHEMIETEVEEVTEVGVTEVVVEGEEDLEGHGGMAMIRSTGTGTDQEVQEEMVSLLFPSTLRVTTNVMLPVL